VSRAASLALLLLLGLTGLAAAEPRIPVPRSAAVRDDPALLPPAPAETVPSLPPRPPDLPSAASGAIPRADEPATLAPVSITGAALRLLGAVTGVGLLLAASVFGVRRFLHRVGPGFGGLRARGAGRDGTGWLARWVPDATPEADRIHVVSRGWLGPRESVGVIQVGRERFLVGITAGSIALLSRLDTGGEETGARADRPVDFARELTEVVTPREIPAEAAIRSALARSRERLSRLRPAASGEMRG
jgi:flagellar biogenesis protein FliO